MALAPGSRLGPYEIMSPLGAGGMGEVYRARDTRLERTVAIKILPQHLSANPDMKQRFEREARAISGLQHPQICTLYDVGHDGGLDYLVMECLEGETLAERIRKGPLPQGELLAVGTQVASALERAHRQGIIHRDLKPSNVMLTKSGAKLMDFGLAKASGAGMAAGSGSAPMFSAAVTGSGPSPMSPLTASGTIVGTIQYMSPEQVEGKEADARSDIFAFGAVLYEMATGKRAFEGKSQISIASAILEKEPEPLATARPMSPPALAFVVRTCLAKDPDARFQTAHDVELQLRWIAEGGSQAGVPAPVVSHRKHRERLAWGAAAVLLAIAAVLGWFYWRATSAPPRVWKSYLLAPAEHALGASSLPGAHMAVAPDGHAVVYVASASGGQQLWLQEMNAASAQPLAGTEDASYPFWSPDSRRIGFFAGGKLKRIDVGGGPAQTLCDAPSGRGGTWGRDGTILFAPDAPAALMAVAENGGRPHAVTKLDSKRGETSHRWPWLLPDGRHFLFTVRSNTTDNFGVYVGSLDSPERNLVVAANSNAVYAPPGYLLFVREGTLMAQRFDAQRLATEGDATPLDENVLFSANFSLGAFAASANGVLVYVHGESTAGGAYQIAWYDRGGKMQGAPIPDSSGPVISPDGKMIALEQPTANLVGVWLLDTVRNVRTRFSFDRNFSFNPVWSPDGKQVVFAASGSLGSAVGAAAGASNTSGSGLYIKPVDGSAPEKPLLDSSNASTGLSAADTPLAWSRDGRFLLLRRISGMPEIWALPIQGERKPFPVLQVAGSHLAWADFSPDGKWITYQSDESGVAQVYIAPFPGPGGRWQVSTDGGLQPLWRENQVFFLNGGKLWAADVSERGAGVQLGAPHPLFAVPLQNNPGHWYDISRDGKRFLVNITTRKEQIVPINLVVNWTAGLKR